MIRLWTHVCYAVHCAWRNGSYRVPSYPRVCCEWESVVRESVVRVCGDLEGECGEGCGDNVNLRLL